MGRRGVRRGGAGGSGGPPEDRAEPVQAPAGDLYRSAGAVYLPPPARRSQTWRQPRTAVGRRRRGAGTAMAGYCGKVGVVYAVITDFSLQLQRSEKPGTELGKPCPCAGAAPGP